MIASPATDAPHEVIRLEGVSRTFPSEPPVHALRDVDLTVRSGDYVAVAGPSGSGKSTLLNTLGLLDRPTSGSYWLDGVETNGLEDVDRTWLRGSRIGFVFQSFHLLYHRTVEENVMLGEVYRRGDRATRRQRAVETLQRVGMDHRVGFRPDRLSGGERQRVAIARALLGGPSLLLCDEPTGNLDTANTSSMLDLFDELQDQGTTLLVITHDNLVSRRARRQVRIQDGRLTETDESTEAAETTLVLPTGGDR
ncbi:ABC transporter ATP-binding protein [Streptomyces tubercidicus]|uniref:ABC transporter ATP-binding protein n=1 Tax=Streptomyces tubercidicus TaxID=47759 RepID=UPI0036AEBF79